MKKFWLPALLSGVLISVGCSRGTSEPPSRFANAPEAAPASNPEKAPAAGTRATAEPVAAPVAPPTRAAKPVRREIVVPAGTPISVRTTSSLSTKTNAAGETFSASLAQPLIANGKVLAPAGANVIGRVTSSTPGGKVKGVASIGVRLMSVTLADGSELNVPTGTYVKQANATKKKDALKIGIGSGIGAAIGAIAGGGKGAAIGAGAGAGAGTGAVLLTKGDAAVIPAESLLTFRTTDSVSVAD